MGMVARGRCSSWEAEEEEAVDEAEQEEVAARGIARWKCSLLSDVKGAPKVY